MSKWIDITDELTPEGIRDLKSGAKGGHILMFEHPKAGPIHLRIVCKRKVKGELRVYAVRTYAYTPEEADAEVLVAQKK